MDKTTFNPTILLRCSNCKTKTAHVMISFSNDPGVAITIIYECQDCGETKKVFDLNTLPKVILEPTQSVLIEEKEQLIPIEKEAQIETSA